MKSTSGITMAGFGPLAKAAAEILFSDIMLIVVDGIDARMGLTCSNSSEAEILHKQVQHAKMKVVVADHSKLGATSKYLRCPTKEIDD
jgi:DeoR/GlpR family transcriptional regulator of sugar metabolism